MPLTVTLKPNLVLYYFWPMPRQVFKLNVFAFVLDSLPLYSYENLGCFLNCLVSILISKIH